MHARKKFRNLYRRCDQQNDKCLVLCACLSNLQNEHVETDSQAHLFTPLKRLSVMEHPPGSRTPLPPAVLEAKTASGSDWHSSERAQNLLLV